jgi:DNA-binding transcriptional ArsR family regulator
MTEDEAARCLAELGHPIRLRAFRLLVRAGPEGLSVGDMQRRLGVPASTFAHHLGHLAQAGLVDQQREGRMVVCRADYRRMDRLLAFLQAECCAGLSADGGAAEAEAADEHAA